jgi:hypothetical protein
VDIVREDESEELDELSAKEDGWPVRGVTCGQYDNETNTNQEREECACL